MIKVDNAKITNLLIEETLVLDHTLHGYMRYNPACKIKQYFKCYEYNYVLIYSRKNTRCKACSGSYKTSKYPQTKKQKYFLCNSAHISWDKKCKYKKRKYLRIKAAKQSTLQLYNISSKPFYQKEESLGEMRPLLKIKQRLPLEDRNS